jgi:hypothetical protein
VSAEREADGISVVLEHRRQALRGDERQNFPGVLDRDEIGVDKDRVRLLRRDGRQQPIEGFVAMRIDDVMDQQAQPERLCGLALPVERGVLVQRTGIPQDCHPGDLR